VALGRGRSRVAPGLVDSNHPVLSVSPGSGYGPEQRIGRIIDPYVMSGRSGSPWALAPGELKLNLAPRVPHQDHK
jgi:hypothetical protein